MISPCVLPPLLIRMTKNAYGICRKKVGAKLGQPVLHAIIMHYGTKLAGIAPPDTSKTHTLGFCQKPNLMSIQ